MCDLHTWEVLRIGSGLSRRATKLAVCDASSANRGRLACAKSTCHGDQMSTHRGSLICRKSVPQHAPSGSTAGEGPRSVRGDRRVGRCAARLRPQPDEGVRCREESIVGWFSLSIPVSLAGPAVWVRAIRDITGSAFRQPAKQGDGAASQREHDDDCLAVHVVAGGEVELLTGSGSTSAEPRRR